MFKYWSMSRIKNLVKWLSSWKLQEPEGSKSKLSYLFADFFPGGFVAVGQSPCIYGKGHHGNDREISIFLDHGSELHVFTARFLWWILEGDARVSWTKKPMEPQSVVWTAVRYSWSKESVGCGRLPLLEVPWSNKNDRIPGFGWAENH